MNLWPSQQQWRHWSLPSKLTAIGTLVGIISLGLYGLEKAFQLRSLIWSNIACIIEAKVSSDVMSRVYARGTLQPELKEQSLKPTSQELFYEWQVSLSANENARDISFEIHQLQTDDRVSISPSIGILSEPSKRWYSGFPEPQRSKPDYLLRTVQLSHLSPDAPSTVVAVRRFLEKPLLSSNDLIRIENARSSNCRVVFKSAGQRESAERLQQRAGKLTEHVYQMGGEAQPVPIRRDPGDISEYEIQATTEARCKDDSCSNIEIRQLEARSGKSPYQYEKERRTERLALLKKDLEQFFGCIEGPYEGNHPTQEVQIIQTCVESRQMSSEEMQHFLSVLEKHGVKLNLKKDTEVGVE